MTFHECVTLQPSGDKLPLLGISAEHMYPKDVEKVIYNAIKKGYRTIYTTFVNDNADAIGKSIKKAITDSIVKREELFVIGRLYSSYRQKQHIKPVLQMTLDSLGLDYIDLYLVQFPFATEYIEPKQFPSDTKETSKLKLVKVSLKETWGELEALVDAGLIRNLGISHFNFQSIMDILDHARIPPSVLEIEHHPYLQQRGLTKWARSKGMQILAFAAFGSVSTYYDLPNLIMSQIIGRISDDYDTSPQQILLAWAVRHQAVFIAEGFNGYYADKYVDIDQIKLNDGDIKTIDDLEADARFYKFSINVEGIVLPIF